MYNVCKAFFFSFLFGRSIEVWLLWHIIYIKKYLKTYLFAFMENIISHTEPIIFNVDNSQS